MGKAMSDADRDGGGLAEVVAVQTPLSVDHDTSSFNSSLQVGIYSRG